MRLHTRTSGASTGSHGLLTAKSCGHHRHVGSCPACQRAQLARWRAQLLTSSSGVLYQGRSFGPLTPSGTMPDPLHRK
jgi:hypothetical protein